jgi:protein involved in polysaccharide export with SLBB domain
MRRTWLIFRLFLAGVIAASVSVAAQVAENGGSPVSSVAAEKTSQARTQAEGGFQERLPRYKISAGDTFDVNFELNPEFNQTVTVQPDGFITLRGVGDLHVAGKKVPELTETLRQAFGKILNDPQVSVILKDFEKPYFVADGQVGKPGKYELRGETTVTQAIAEAGGLTEASKHSQVLLFRRVDDHWTEAKIFNLKKMEKSRKLTEDALLHPGDMLFVPKNTFSKIQRFIPNASVGSFIPIQP